MQIKQWPILYGLSSTNKVKQWEILVVENKDQTATIITKTGYIDGKIRDIPKLISEGKNIGKVNETTPYEQAISEAQSQWNKKRDKNYELEIIDRNNYMPRVMLPMLASNPGKGKILFPCYIQPKLNGVCNLVELNHSKVLHHSRGGKLFETITHLDHLIKEINPPAPLHGELYYHGWSLQKIGSYTKELKIDADALQFWVYDMAWLDKTFEIRFNWIYKNISSKHFPIIVTPTNMVYNIEEVKQYHDQWVSRGFEGAVLKNINGLYQFEFRSKDIEKVKEYQDAEFEIIGGKQGTGLDAGCIIYKCKTKNGNEFDVRPKGSVDERQQLYKELDQAIGKILTVRFFEYSDSGVPLQPVGICIRDYE